MPRIAQETPSLITDGQDSGFGWRPLFSLVSCTIWAGSAGQSLFGGCALIFVVVSVIGDVAAETSLGRLRRVMRVRYGVL